jgi:hypothetical protein
MTIADAVRDGHAHHAVEELGLSHWVALPDGQGIEVVHLRCGQAWTWDPPLYFDSLARLAARHICQD